jgi:hypothetical protein|tara:strand:+ start:452 stop:658 length:207 start_codon:yes stop_codon:yes gene_type:complete
MAYKYKVEEAFKDSTVHRGEKSYKLASCSQKDLKKLHDLGLKYILEEVEAKKESKETEDKESVDGKEG